jgi:hypothetical protein
MRVAVNSRQLVSISSGIIVDAMSARMTLIHSEVTIGIPTPPHVPAHQSCRSTSVFFNSAISFAGLRPFGQAFEQFMIVWQR